MILAEQQGRLAYALRSTNDTTTVDIPEATLSTIRSPLQSQIAEITGVSMSPTNAQAGDTLTVTITVKNTSTEVIHTQGPDPEIHVRPAKRSSLKTLLHQTGKLRVGVSFDGHPSIDFPYRWGLGGDLAPGASTTVVGYIKLTYDMKPTNFWAGLIEEPATILQDNEGTTLISVLPDNVAVVSVDAANVRSGPNIASSVIGQLGYGTEVPILGQEKDWFKVKLPDGRQGFVAAGWIICPSSRERRIRPWPTKSECCWSKKQRIGLSFTGALARRPGRRHRGSGVRHRSGNRRPRHPSECHRARSRGTAGSFDSHHRNAEPRGSRSGHRRCLVGQRPRGNAQSDAYGARDYLSKPIGRDDLSRAVLAVFEVEQRKQGLSGSDRSKLVQTGDVFVIFRGEGWHRQDNSGGEPGRGDCRGDRTASRPGRPRSANG